MLTHVKSFTGWLGCVDGLNGAGGLAIFGDWRDLYAILYYDDAVPVSVRLRRRGVGVGGIGMKGCDRVMTEGG